MDKSNIQDIYELTPMQKGMLFHSLKDTKENFYFVQGFVYLEGDINSSILEESLNRVIDKYDVLRTIFLHENLKQPVQVVLKKRYTKIHYKDISDFSETDKSSFLDEYKKRDRESIFDLSKDVLIRLHLIKISSDRYELIWNFHHIIMDGWCWGIVFEELLNAYEEIMKGKNTSTKKSSTDYKDYIKWIKSNSGEKEIQYWKSYLEGYDEAVAIPYQLKENGNIRKPNEYTFKLKQNVKKDLMNLAKEMHTTINNVFQCAWGILLQKYNRVEDVVFGAVVSGRPPEVANVESIIGLFINTVPVRVKVQSKETFRSLMEKIHYNSVEKKSYEYSSLSEIQRNSDCSGNLIQNILVFENYASSMDSIKEKCSKLGFSFLDGGSIENNNYDLSVIIQPVDDIEISFAYNEALYDKDFIKRMANHLQQIIISVISNPDIEIKEIDILTALEKTKLLEEIRKTHALYPKDKTINGLFLEQVKKTPENVALVYDGKSMTYKELNELSNQLARYLLRTGVKSEMVIGVSVNRSFEMIISILAIIKAGATYLPIDPNYPDERIQYTLDDSKASILIVNDSSQNLSYYKGKIVDLSLIEWKSEARDDLAERSSPTDMAYIIYTSGSTGNPKGVMIEHRNVVRLLFNDQNLFDFDSNDCWTMFHSMCFDFSVWEMYGALLYGGKLIIVSLEEAKDPRKFREILFKEKVTILNQTPSAFNILCQEEKLYDNRLFIRKVIFGGEALSPIQLKEWNSKYPEAALINMYGITETTVHVTYKEITKKEIESNISNIGTSIPTLYTYILDQDMNLMPIGVPGELYVSGEGVARGYLNREELTNERFILNPFKPEEKMYKSGDLARWNSNLEMEYIGRIDHQVKIRGHRIELNEVNTQLLLFDGVKEGIVVSKVDKMGFNYLCAYFVAEDNLDLSSLRRHMNKNLPEYMVPSYFVELDELPITSNGKIKRDALPEPNMKRNRNQEYIEPKSELELSLISIYQSILDIDYISVNDNFFEIGGHSLKATMLVSRIQKEIGFNIPIKEVFLNPSVREMANFIESSAQGERSALNIEKVKHQESYPISSQQKRLYSIQQYDDTGISYNIPFAFEIHGELHKLKLEKALNQLIERHEILRTSFVMKFGEVVQVIEESCQCILQYLESQESDIHSIVNSLIHPFELEKAPLIRAYVIKIEDDRHILLLDIHHIVCDGQSINILMNDLLLFYQEQSLPIIQIQYKDYVAWQEKWYQTDDFLKQEAYWLNRFADEIPSMDFPTDYPRTPMQTFTGRNIEFQITQELTKKLKKLSISQKATLNMTLMSIYKILLAKYSGNKDIIVGSPLSGRPTPQLDNTIGMFANVVPIRTNVPFEKSFIDYLKEVKNELINVYGNGDYPLEFLIDKIGLQRDPSRNPLFDTMFILQDNDSSIFEGFGFEIKEFKLNESSSKFDFTWEAHVGKELTINLCYNSSLFKHITIERMITHFKQIIEKIVENPNIMIGEIDMVSDEEKHEILNVFNGQNKSENLSGLTIIELFEERVRLSPNVIAVCWQDKTLTYKELNQMANKWARILREKGVKPNQVVGLMTPPSLNMLVGMMGILKSGAAYLPIDPAYPSERINYLLQDSNANLILTVNGQPLPIEYKYDYIFMDDEDILPVSDLNLAHISSPNDLAYLIYTSGSTGMPKGVMIEHHSLCNLTMIADTLGLIEGKKVLQFASFSFDASVWEIFPSLVSGATIYIEEKELLLEYNLSQWMKEKEINVATLPPSVLRTMEYIELPNLETIVTAGEACTHDIKNKWSEGRRFINAYGPTEATVCATLGLLNKESTHITIGKPIINTSVYILDESHRLQPVGVPGELCISGAGLAKGYLNRAELTDEKFINNPFESGAKLYKTGDLARWLPNGNIEYIGRIDNQVKIRGYRVEIGEVTESLLQHEAVKEAFILPVSEQNSTTLLVAYYVAQSNCEDYVLRNYLNKILPKYMIPSYFIQVPQLPLTINGKVDKKVLPKPKKRKTKGTQPRNLKEHILKKVWQKALGVAEFGIEDNFFELGGDSIKAIQIVALLKQDNYKIKIKDIFEFPSISELSQYLKEQNTEQLDEKVEGTVPLSPIQHWVFRLTKNPHHWNQAIMLENPNGWNEDAIRRSFKIITSHHDALRMIFKNTETGIKQINLPAMSNHFDFEIFEFMEENPTERIEQEANRLQRDINLELGPLVKLGLFKTSFGEHLLIIINHLVVDAVSWRIILDDFEYLYRSIIKGLEIKLPSKTTSFKDWSIALNEYANQQEFLQEKQYWEKINNSRIELLKPDIFNHELTHSFNDMDEIDVIFTEETTQQLLKKAPSAYGTEINDLLLAALVIAIRDWTGNEKIAIDLESHGRQELFENQDITRTVGWFTAFYPVIYELTKDDIASTIKDVIRTHASIPNKGIGYSLLEFLTNYTIEEGVKVKLRPEILFNYLGQFDDGLQEQGIPSSGLPIGDLINRDMIWPYNLELNGFVLNGRLQYTVRYNRKMFSKPKITDVVNMFHDNLLAIVKHCLEKDLQLM